MHRRLLELTCDDAIGQIRLPTRTPFYNLPPIGMGTWAAESLTSYIARLAASHTINILDFATTALNVEIRKDGSRWKLFSRGSYSLKVNGISTLSKGWTDKLARQTGQNRLAKTNFANFSGILSYTGLLRDRRAWCHLCLHDLRENITYEPLFWSLHYATVCPVHEVRLTTTCPSCKAQAMPVLTQRYIHGHCTRCGSWLGVPGDNDSSFSQWDRWTSNQIASLISRHTVGVENPRHSTVRDNLYVLMRAIGDGRQAQFARSIHAPKPTCSMWFNDKALPTLDYWLRICWVSGIELGEIFYSTISPNDIDSDRLKLGESVPWQQRMARRKIDWKCVEQRLIDICYADVAPHHGLGRIANQLQVDLRCLKKKFPELCGHLAKKSFKYWTVQPAQRSKGLKEQIEQTVINIARNGQVPTRRRVALELGFPTGDIHDRRLQLAWQAAKAALDCAQK